MGMSQRGGTEFPSETRGPHGSPGRMESESGHARSKEFSWSLKVSEQHNSHNNNTTEWYRYMCVRYALHMCGICATCVWCIHMCDLV